MHILLTTDKLSGNYYYSKYSGNLKHIKHDPANKFKSIKLEDGTWSVVTTLYKSFGTVMSYKHAFNNLPNTVEVEPKKVFRPNYTNKILEAVKHDITLDEPETIDTELIFEPTDTPAPVKKKTKGKPAKTVQVKEVVEIKDDSVEDKHDSPVDTE